MELTKREKRKFRQHSSRQKQEDDLDLAHETKIDQSKIAKTSSKYKRRFYFIGIGIASIIVILISYSVYSSSKPGTYDGFAKCLSEKGAIMYGAMDWCKYTQAQKAMFGTSFKYLNYHNHDELPGIRTTPTWVIDNERYENVQSFERLSALTGCKI